MWKWWRVHEISGLWYFKEEYVVVSFCKLLPLWFCIFISFHSIYHHSSFLFNLLTSLDFFFTSACFSFIIYKKLKNFIPLIILAVTSFYLVMFCCRFSKYTIYNLHFPLLFHHFPLSYSSLEIAFTKMNDLHLAGC